MSAPASTSPAPAAVVWHDAECGGYGADLPFWERLAAGTPGPILELGAGTGRVALHLAARGQAVVALERDPILAGALEARATARSLPIETVCADVRELALDRRFTLIVASMQFLHLLGGEAGRAKAWRALSDHLAPGGVLAAAVLSEPLPPSGRPDPLPDVREVGGWVHSSVPLDVRVGAESVELDRLRQLVSPDGVLSEELETTRLDRLPLALLEAEARAAGLRLVGTEPIAEAAEHVGSLLVVIEASGG